MIKSGIIDPTKIGESVYENEILYTNDEPANITIKGKILSYDTESGLCEVILADNQTIVMDRKSFTVDVIETALKEMEQYRLTDEEIAELLK